MNTAFITGHRHINYRIVSEGIHQLTDRAIERGFTTFLSGMAIGTDLLAAQIWSERYLTWKAILPCSDQSRLWTYKQQILYRKLLTKATEIKILYPQYKQGVMQGRDQYLVKNSQLCLAVWDGRETGGAFLTIEMARKAKLPLIIFNPKTLEISCEEPPKQLNLFG